MAVPDGAAGRLYRAPPPAPASAPAAVAVPAPPAPPAPPVAVLSLRAVGVWLPLVHFSVATVVTGATIVAGAGTAGPAGRPPVAVLSVPNHM